MLAAMRDLKLEWRHFRHDPPGERFRNHRIRMRQKSRSHSAVALALGVLLLAVGIVLLFMPGPGIPLIVFGLALIGSHSARLSGTLDRAEPRARARAHDLATWWQTLPRIYKGLVIAAAGVLVTVAVVATGAVVEAYVW